MFEIYEQLFNKMMAKDGLKVSKSVKIGLMMANRFKKAKDNLIYAGTVSDNLDTEKVDDCLGMENEWKLNAIDFAKLEKNLGFRLIEDEQYYRDLMIQKIWRHRSCERLKGAAGTFTHNLYQRHLQDAKKRIQHACH